MSLLAVSLFLPYTVDFSIESDSPETSIRPSMERSATGSVLDVHEQPSSGLNSSTNSILDDLRSEGGSNCKSENASPFQPLAPLPIKAGIPAMTRSQSQGPMSLNDHPTPIPSFLEHFSSTIPNSPWETPREEVAGKDFFTSVKVSDKSATPSTTPGLGLHHPRPHLSHSARENDKGVKSGSNLNPSASPENSHSLSQFSSDLVKAIGSSQNRPSSEIYDISYTKSGKPLMQPKSRAVTPPPQRRIIPERPSMKETRKSYVNSKPKTPGLGATPTAVNVLAPKSSGDTIGPRKKQEEIGRKEKELLMEKKNRRTFFDRRNSNEENTDRELFANASWTIEKYPNGNQGFFNGIKRAEITGLVKSKKWIGTCGMPTDILADSTKNEIETKLSKEYDSVPVFVNDKVFINHYNHYCKEILWPTFHYQLPDDVKSKAYEDYSWEHYKALNQLFADKIVETYQPGDHIWINDYHLLLVPQMIRSKLPSANISLFLHVPFPSSELFRCLASRNQLLEGMLGANCIGLQTVEFSRHFLQTCNRLLAVDADEKGIRFKERSISVVSCPIGIDPPSLRYIQAENQDVNDWKKMIRERWPNKKLIVSRDKLDSLRGLKQKFLAYEDMLKKHPELREECLLIQVTPKGISDNDKQLELESDLSTIVNRINSYSDTLISEPSIIFLNQDIEFEQYMALISEADIFAVTCLREGMNLTCHEFIFATERQGTLILSEFVGSASVLGSEHIDYVDNSNGFAEFGSGTNESSYSDSNATGDEFEREFNHNDSRSTSGGGALLVNPWNKIQLSNAFYTCLKMSEKEKKARHENLYTYVCKNTSLIWVRDFTQFCQKSWIKQQEYQNVPKIDLKLFKEQYSNTGSNKSAKRLFFINSDGYTNKRITPRTRLPIYLSLDRRQAILADLIHNPDNTVYIMSSEGRREMNLVYKGVNDVGLIAENGAYIKKPSHTMNNEWVSLVGTDEKLANIDSKRLAKENKLEWMKEVKKTFESIAVRFPGSVISVKESFIVFYINQSHNTEHGQLLIGETLNHINDAYQTQNVSARVENGAITVGRRDVNNLSAIKYILEDLESSTEPEPRKALTFLLVASADRHDEMIYEWLNENADNDSIKIDAVATMALGYHKTASKGSVSGVNEFYDYLGKLIH
ncbi:hypothetical protein NADFUDRAFT_83339 [Nadsonia fulvescens var. elongata DSM 6958]|uniref:Uncharacterized protein n=1 Tax=Nadsonia fulvescens var. elongata DSM 6958 TaxID=857566 RepID=A0A1E3PJ59_9ASCO|nr:hypothetical protein NADFUDRAFT_83339 [Nadsonia fulvescens var. elongata DSM 6958]